MTNKNAINLIKAEIASLNRMLETIDEIFENVIDMINSCSGKMVIIGIGKSGHIGQSAITQNIQSCHQIT